MKRSKLSLFFSLYCITTVSAAGDLENASIPITNNNIRTQLELAEFYRDSGNYVLADKIFTRVVSYAEQSGDKIFQAVGLADLGYNYYLTNDTGSSEIILLQAKTLAQSLNNSKLLALIDNYLGLLYLSKQMPEKAEFSFDDAIKIAKNSENNDLNLITELNRIELYDVTQRISLLNGIYARVLKLSDGGRKNNLLITLSEKIISLREGLSYLAADEQSSINKQLENIIQSLNEVYLSTGINSQPVLHIQAQLYLAQLNQYQDKYKDAIAWIEKGIEDAQLYNLPYFLVQLELLRGKILHQQNNIDSAINAYRHAATSLDKVREVLPFTFYDGESSVKKIIDPVYRGLANVLLIKAAQESSQKSENGSAEVSDKTHKLIAEAIKSIESIKETELKDFFNDRCSIEDTQAIHLEKSDIPETAIIYPVFFEDRIELLFKKASGNYFIQKTVKFKDEDFDKVSKNFYKFLNTKGENKNKYQSACVDDIDFIPCVASILLQNGMKSYLSVSNILYRMLWQPYENILQQEGIKNIVYIPDGALRKIPFSSLRNDKNKYAVEDYSITTLPSLTLKKFPEVKEQSKRSLIARLSNPEGGAIDELIEKYPNIINLVSVAHEVTDNQYNDGKDHKNLADARKKIIENYTLSNVDDEVKPLKIKNDYYELVNSEFTYENFEKTLSENSHSIVHIASHGRFGKNVEDSFIMAYDKLIPLKDFQNMLNSQALRQNPLDLLTLSACQTAEGDDKALLGFSGIAIKSNARTAIGSLWPVDDKATIKLMERFYSNFENASKAQALRKAQLELLSDPKYEHPFYWAPFILVGQWQ